MELWLTHHFGDLGIILYGLINIIFYAGCFGLFIGLLIWTMIASFRNIWTALKIIVVCAIFIIVVYWFFS